MKIWHNNSGKGDNASWFLKFIIIHDVQTREKFYFLCQDWLAVEKGNEKLDKDLFVACDPQKTEIKYFLQNQAKHNLNDSHLWLSLFNRPIKSSFSRLDRVTCCFVLIYLSSFLNILYYDKSNETTSQTRIDFVYFNLTLEQVNLNFLFFTKYNRLVFYLNKLDFHWYFYKYHSIYSGQLFN